MNSDLVTCCTGFSHTICLDHDGVAYYCGDAQTEKKTEIPKRVPNLPKIKRISCGAYTSIFLDETGTMWSLGSAGDGFLSLRHNFSAGTPVKIESDPMREICCGWTHTLCISEENDLWGFGSNDFGQLCNGEINTFGEMNLINTKQKNIIKMAAGFKFSIIQNIDKELFGCGINKEDQFGTGDNHHITLIPLPKLPPNIISFKCGYGHCLYLDNQGKVYSIGNNSNGELGLGHCQDTNEISEIPNIPKIKKISAMRVHNLLLDEENNVWMFGSSNGNSLSNVAVSTPVKLENLPEIIDISGGPSSCSWLKDTNDGVWVFGDNSSGQLGLKNGQKHVLTPTKLSKEYSHLFAGLVETKGKSARK